MLPRVPLGSSSFLVLGEEPAHKHPAFAAGQAWFTSSLAAHQRASADFRVSSGNTAVELVTLL